MHTHPQLLQYSITGGEMTPNDAKLKPSDAEAPLIQGKVVEQRSTSQNFSIVKDVMKFGRTPIRA
jgi:hypothetical protein